MSLVSTMPKEKLSTIVRELHLHRENIIVSMKLTPEVQWKLEIMAEIAQVYT